MPTKKYYALEFSLQCVRVTKCRSAIEDDTPIDSFQALNCVLLARAKSEGVIEK